MLDNDGAMYVLLPLMDQTAAAGEALLHTSTTPHRPSVRMHDTLSERAPHTCRAQSPSIPHANTTGGG